MSPSAIMFRLYRQKQVQNNHTYGGVKMQKYFKISSFVFSLVCFSILLYGSDCSANSSEKPIIIRKKIVDQKSVNKTSATDAGSKSDSKMERFEPKSEISLINTKVVPLYDPAGKIDPFEPLFKETPKIKSAPWTYTDTGRKPTTELEKIDLSQLRLTGIILAASGNKALIQEASGRGHVISKGTYIGTHGGRVSGVLRDMVIVEEKMKDVTGRLFIQKIELQLNKKSG